jgi:hypothetical protein
MKTIKSLLDSQLKTTLKINLINKIKLSYSTH